MTFIWVDVRGIRFSNDRDPRTCPICHYAVEPIEETWKLAEDEHILEIAF
ncbi:MAG: hypothetical protein JXA73_22985 [Acidobacteria bacterium]|nr:hypothetical protein [Acidobacteriota bacterium]